MARRQEQEPAREEISEVAPGILRMELPIRLPGLGHVNMYALLDDEGAAVLDPGLPGPATWRAIQDRLKQAGLRVKDVHTVLISHSHPDHFGCAVRFQKESGANVVAHRRFSFGPVQVSQGPEVSLDDIEAGRREEERGREGEDEAPDEVHQHVHAPPPVPWGGKTPWGGDRPRPPLKRRIQWRLMKLLGKGFLPTITQGVEHGDELRLGGREMFVFHTPGHTADHFCLHDPETGTLLAGDHVLPSITPHISGLSATRDPLASFFYSLDRVAEISGVGQVLPAHGHPFDDLPARTEAIKRHHAERLARVKEISREYGRPASTAEFTRHLFAQRNWGSMADSETYAHLEHLRLLGEAERSEGGDGVPLYVAG